VAVWFWGDSGLRRRDHFTHTTIITDLALRLLPPISPVKNVLCTGLRAKGKFMVRSDLRGEIINPQRLISRGHGNKRLKGGYAYMGIDIAHSYILSDIQKAILTTSELMGPQRIADLIVGVRLNEISKLNYADLLITMVKNRTVRVPGGLFAKNSYQDALESALESSPSSEEKIREDIEFLERLDLLERSKSSHYSPHLSWFGRAPVCLTKEGRRLAQAITDGRVPLVRPPKVAQVTIFFAGAFGHDDVDALYAQEIDPACVELGYSTYRVDAREPFQTITSSILSGIQNSFCVLADLTYARPSVYFEVGIAHGLGIPLVLTCRRDHLRSADDGLKVHFDLEQYKISFWSIDDSMSEIFWPKLMHPIERLKGIVGGSEHSLVR
jgi:hypothetical protein